MEKLNNNPSNSEKKPKLQQPTSNPGSTRRNFLVRGFTAIATLQGGNVFGEEKSGVENNSKLTTNTPQISGSPEKTKTYDELQTNINNYIKDLGMFDKLALVNELKAKADILISILKSEKNIHSPEVVRVANESNKQVKTVLTKYTQGVKELSQKEEMRAVHEMIKLIEMVKVTSLGDLKTKFG